MDINRTFELKKEFSTPVEGKHIAYDFAKARGYEATAGMPESIMRGEAMYELFASAVPYIYKNDLVVGSIRMRQINADDESAARAKEIVSRHGERWFATNADHFCANYRRILKDGIPGTIKKIDESLENHKNDEEKVNTLKGMKRSMEGFAAMLKNHADAAKNLMGKEGYDDEALAFIADNCGNLTVRAPETFGEAIQLVWLCHTAFSLEYRYAMALGRIDQYLYPFYKKDIEAGKITPEKAQERVENIFMKIHEHRACFNVDDVVNIAIGGTAPNGDCDVNELSYIVLRAVGRCNVPGPNLSARITHHTPDDFLDECLQTIGTGLGYPALMNDEVNIPALERYGYAHEDVCDYCMVGCIENFISGMQPPWSDNRFDPPKYFEHMFNNGKPIIGDKTNIDTGDISDIKSMDEFMERYSRHLAEGAKDYAESVNRENTMCDPKVCLQPFLSCFCDDCIGRGQDINDGGAKYPSAHGAVLMGVGTVSDSLAAIEKVVFIDKAATLGEIRDAMLANFEGYEELRKLLLDAPKYGNNDDFVDKYAVWFVDFLSAEFDKYKLYDGGAFYIAMAANTSNIWAGMSIAATPDGRLAGRPLSDAASPTYGKDMNGPTSTVLSVTKPDYKKVACGTVINQKFYPDVFSDENRAKLQALIRVYFARGGQEMQINATSRETLIDAMKKPEDYKSLVVRVSGFSAYYTTLDRAVQEDILERTQQNV